MKRTTLLDNPAYDPNKLIDWLVKEVFKVKNDAALCRVLDMAPPALSKIRSRKLPVGDSLLVKLHDLTGMHIWEIRLQMGIA